MIVGMVYISIHYYHITFLFDIILIILMTDIFGNVTVPTNTFPETFQ